jgi:hypothetical protein
VLLCALHAPSSSGVLENRPPKKRTKPSWFQATLKYTLSPTQWFSRNGNSLWKRGTDDQIDDNLT